MLCVRLSADNIRYPLKTYRSYRIKNQNKRITRYISGAIMKYTFEKAEKSTVKVKITLDAKDWNQAQVDAYNKDKNKYSLPGFRKGKVPMKVLENTYGKGLFFEEAVNIAFPKYMDEVLEKEPSIEMVAQPSVDFEDVSENGITFVAMVPVKPEVKLGAYKGIKFEKPVYNVTDKDIEDELKRIQDRNSRLVSVTDRASKEGDEVVIDYSGSVDGKKFDGGTAEKQTLVLGSKTFIPGFEEQVEGMNVGEEKDITVKFPDDYGVESLKGKEAVFHIVLHEIKVKELPEITDAFIKEATGSETVEAYKEETKKKLTESNEKRAERELENKMVEFITDASEVEIPEALVENQIDNMVKETEYRMSYQGLKLEDFLKYTHQTMAEYRKGYKDQAKKTVKQQLVIDAIIKAENIVATDDEVKERVTEMYKKQGREVPETVENSETSARQFDYFREDIVINKLFDMLKKENTIA